MLLTCEAVRAEVIQHRVYSCASGTAAGVGTSDIGNQVQLQWRKAALQGVLGGCVEVKLCRCDR